MKFQKLPDPIRMLLATATVYRSVADLTDGDATAVLRAAADDLERHAERLRVVTYHDQVRN